MIVASDHLMIQVLLQSSTSKKLTRLLSKLLGGKFFCFHELPESTKRQHRCRVNSELLLLAQRHFTAFVQKISNCGETKNTIDKVVNVLVCASPHRWSVTLIFTLTLHYITA